MDSVHCFQSHWIQSVWFLHQRIECIESKYNGFSPLASFTKHNGLNPLHLFHKLVLQRFNGFNPFRFLSQWIESKLSNQSMVEIQWIQSIGIIYKTQWIESIDFIPFNEETQKTKWIQSIENSIGIYNVFGDIIGSQ